MNQNPVSFRCSAELKKLMEKTARHCHCSVTDVMRSICIGIFRHRAVIQKEIGEMYYGTSEVMTFRGIRVPDIPLEELRKLIALRCMEELEKPVRVIKIPKVKFTLL